MKHPRRQLFTLLLLAVACIYPSPAQKPAGPSATKAAPVADPLDINTATPAQLKALKGVGDAYSKRIIDGRPYTAKNQIVTRGIVPQATYDGIKDQVIARAPKK